MEQVNTTMQHMLQMVTAMQSAAGAEKTVQGEDGGFRELLDKAKQSEAQETQRPEKQQTAKKSDETETAQQTEAARPSEEEEKPDEAALQELAAMQNLYVKSGAIDLVQMTPDAGAQAATDVTAAAAAVEQPEMTQQAPAQTGPAQELTEQPAQQSAAQQPVEDAGQTVAQDGVQPAQQTAVEQPRQTEGRQDRQGGEEAPELTATVERPEEDTEVTEQAVFGQVETAPIKISDTAAPRQVEQPQAMAESAPDESVETQVEAAVTKALEQGETRVTMQLDPAELGQVTIELTQRSDGSIAIALHADNSNTRALLEKDMPGLQQQLSANGQREVQVEVSRHEEAQWQDMKDGHQQHERQQQEQHRTREDGDFLDRLRLGLVSLEEI